MAFKRVTRGLSMEPLFITGEEVGAGDGSKVEFVLDYINPREGSLVVYLNGTSTEEYSLEGSTGTITFSTAPGSGVAVTADYLLGVDDVLLTASAPTVVIGMQVANKHESDAGAVTVKVGDTYLASSVGVPTKAAIAPLSGKLVLEAGDVLRVFASDDGLLDVTLSYMEA